MSKKEEIPLIDDVGSFPLPPGTDEKTFTEFYWKAYDSLVAGFDIKMNPLLRRNVYAPLMKSMEYKVSTGLDVINYPQHINMHDQFIIPIRKYGSEDEPFVIPPEKAVMPEMIVAKEFAREYYERTGKRLRLKACVTGALEIYLKMSGFSVYKDIAMNLAKTVNNFMKNIIYREKYVETYTVAVDEPSIGYVTFGGITNDDIIDILEASVKGIDIDVQIHLHTLNLADVALRADGIDILTCEYAGDKRNVISPKELEQYDKFIRVGITRTALGSMVAEKIEKGGDPRYYNTREGILSVIESKEIIKKNLDDAVKRYGNRLKYVGPDCGLRSWNYPEAAAKLLKRTTESVREYFGIND